MSSISWIKRPTVVVVAALIAAACSSDNKKSPSTDGGPDGAVTTAKCGNGVVDTGEVCDTTAFKTATCSSETLGADTSGTLTCSADCKSVTHEKCTAGGGGGSGGAMGDGGGMNMDGGPDAMTDAGKGDSGMMDSGSGGTGGTDAGKVDSGHAK